MTSTTTTTYSAPVTSSRPLGVAILAILIGLYGFVLFLLGLLVAVGSTVFAAVGGGNLLGSIGVSGAIG
ncbi:MAG: hypothetical protein WBF81_07910, partial [Thermoplasmata archaeon]